ncbi:hypothetical protein [Streptomyces sp. NPDC005283]|uniref:hypothetical protein n=1 Tax=Streptomyces sp. NPDC005283 TaxID=3156871 RepID=UPI0034517983
MPEQTDAFGIGVFTLDDRLRLFSFATSPQRTDYLSVLRAPDGRVPSPFRAPRPRPGPRTRRFDADSRPPGGEPVAVPAQLREDIKEA